MARCIGNIDRDRLFRIAFVVAYLRIYFGLVAFCLFSKIFSVGVTAAQQNDPLDRFSNIYHLLDSSGLQSVHAKR